MVEHSYESIPTICDTVPNRPIHFFVIVHHFMLEIVVRHISVLMKKIVQMAEFVLRKIDGVTALMAIPECNANLKTHLVFRV